MKRQLDKNKTLKLCPEEIDELQRFKIINFISTFKIKPFYD